MAKHYLITQSSYDTGTLSTYIHGTVTQKAKANRKLKALILLEKECMLDCGHQVSMWHHAEGHHAEVTAIDGDWMSVFAISELEVA